MNGSATYLSKVDWNLSNRHHLISTQHCGKQILLTGLGNGNSSMENLNWSTELCLWSHQMMVSEHTEVVD